MVSPLARAARFACALALPFAVAALLPAPARADWPASGIQIDSFNHGVYETLLLPDGSGGVLAAQRVAQSGSRWYTIHHVSPYGVVLPDGYTDDYAGFYYEANGTARGAPFFPLQPFQRDAQGAMWWSQLVSYTLPPNYFTLDSVSIWVDTPQGDGTWTTQHRAVRGAAEIYVPNCSSSAPDDAGGAYVTWINNIENVGYKGWIWLRLQHLASTLAPAPGWPDTGRIVRANRGPTNYVNSVGPLHADGAGGVYMVWDEDAPHVQRYDASGAVSAGWPAEGLRLCPSFASAHGVAFAPVMFAEAGGYTVGWYDASDPGGQQGYRLQRFTAAGALAPGWPADGVLAYSGAITDSIAAFQMVSDGQGGAYLSWKLKGVPYARRVLADGTVPAAWDGAGVRLVDAAGIAPLSNLLNTEQAWRVATGADGGLLVAWDDVRYGAANSRVRLRWLRGDGTLDPATPDTGVVIAAADVHTVALTGLLADGNGGAFVTRRTLPLAYPEWTSVLLHRIGLPSLAGVPQAPRVSALALVSAGRNPVVGAVEVRCTLPRDGVASVALYDLGGRRLRESSVSGAGAHLARFGDLGGLPPGVYLVRLVQGGESRAVRVTLLR
jgi:hypothetical protein